MRGLAFFPLLLILCAPFFSAPAQERESVQRVESLSIKGNGDVDIKEIKSVISEIVPPRRLFFWKQLPEFDKLEVEKNIDFLRQFLAGSGYYSSSVVWRAEIGENKKTVALIIDISLGYPVTVSEVVVDIKGGIPPEHVKRIWKSLGEVPLARGERFSVQRFKKAKGVIRNALLEMGYARADFDSRGEINRRERRAFVNFTIDPGKFYTFGNIEIQASEDALRDLVIKNITYKTGEPSSPSKLIEARRHLINLGYFDSVSVISDIDDEAAVVHTVIKPVRSKTMTFQFGVGAGSVDKLRGRVRLINRNFFNLNRTFEISATASFVSRGAAAVIRQPGVFGADSALALLFDVRRDDFPSYEADFLIGSAEIRKEFANRTLSLHFNPTVLDSTIRSQSLDANITRGLENVFLVTLRAGADFVKVDNPVDPFRGFTAGVESEISGDFLGSDESYVKAVFDTAGYLNFGGVVLAKRFQAGFIEPFGRTRGGDIPRFTRLFAGGGKSMRGYSFQRLGPRDRNGDPLGGNTLITGSVETRVPLWRKLGGVLFLDYGNVFPDSFDYDLDDLRYAVGAGLRYKVAGIPLAFDFGYALNPDSGLKRYRFFVDVGQAF